MEYFYEKVKLSKCALEYTIFINEIAEFLTSRHLRCSRYSSLLFALVLKEDGKVASVLQLTHLSLPFILT